MPKAKTTVLDSNIFISSIKGNEKFSEDSSTLIKKIQEGKLILAEPTILLAEVVDAVGRYLNKEKAKKAENILNDIVSYWVDCNKEFCSRAGHIGYLYNIYGCDALYAQVALDYNAPFVSLDIEELVTKLKEKGIEAYSVSEYLVNL